MEALAVAGSIVGMVSLAIQLIDKFNATISDQSVPQAEELRKDLRSSGRLLNYVCEIATRVEKLHSNAESDLLLQSLGVQLEDYTRELQGWIAVGEHEFAPSVGGTKREGRFLKFFDSASHNPKSKIRTTVRGRIGYYEDKIDQILRLIGRQLDVDHTLKLQQIDTKVEKVVQSVTDEACQMACKLEEISTSSHSILSRSISSEARLEEVSSSIMAEFRDMKAALSEILSSISSHSRCSNSNQSADLSSNDQSNDEEEYEENHDEDDEEAGDEEDDDEEAGDEEDDDEEDDREDGQENDPEDDKCLDAADSNSRSPLSSTEARSNPADPVEATKLQGIGDTFGSEGAGRPASENSESQEAEFEILQQATDDISNALQRLYQPIVSEYISKLLAWQLLSRFYQAVSDQELPPAGDHRHDTFGTLEDPRIHSKTKLRHMARQLLAARAFCVREGHSDAIVEAEAKFQVNEATRDSWAEHDDQPPEQRLLWKQVLHSEATKVSDEDAARDLAVRVNTWMFSMLAEHPEHILLHRALYSQISRALETAQKAAAIGRNVRELSDGVSGSNYTQQQQSIELLELTNMTDDTWKAFILRSWFLDDTVTLQSCNTTLSLVSDAKASIQTEGTIRAIRQHERFVYDDESDEDEKDVWKIEEDGFGRYKTTPDGDSIVSRSEGVPSKMTRQPTVFYEGFRMPQEYCDKDRVNVTHPSSRVSHHRLKAAKAALKMYTDDTELVLDPYSVETNRKFLEHQALVPHPG